MTELGLLGVYVTFVDELASLNAACVSHGGHGRSRTTRPMRTYKIVRKPADGLAYAAAIARQVPADLPQLKERLAS